MLLQHVLSVVVGVLLAYIFSNACYGNGCTIVQTEREELVDRPFVTSDDRCVVYSSRNIECGAEIASKE